MNEHTSYVPIASESYACNTYIPNTTRTVQSTRKGFCVHEQCPRHGRMVDSSWPLKYRQDVHRSLSWLRLYWPTGASRIGLCKTK